ncbi:MAG: EamA family transporter [Anaerolineae bacterium]|nr:EamA family transporter [Anaerolineae bacterium]MCO5192696.1 EamA family transporter [Anaerolineae bacterium]
MNSTRHNNKVWIAFLALALMWGTSFMFIKIAVQTLQPFTMVGLRLLIGWLGLLAILKWKRLSLPRDRMMWRHFAFMGAFNTAIPFVLFTWAESGVSGIESSTASVLNSTVPLFTIILAGFVFHTEAVTGGKVVGLLLGFAGVVLLFAPELERSEIAGLLPYFAILVATLCYAFSAIYARRYLQGVRPVILAFSQLLVADFLVWIAALLLEDFSTQSVNGATVFALIWLGLLGSCFAYLCYFYVLQQWGATRATTVTYLLPVIGVISGVVFLGEMVTVLLILGGALIVIGVWAVNWRPDRVKVSKTMSL